MTAKKKQMSGAVNQRAFEKAIRDNLSPEGVAAIIALLQPASNYRNDATVNEQALNQVDWFRETLLELIGVPECNRLMDEIGM
jgi:hypothetical protein